jgi:hypothetical protein
MRKSVGILLILALVVSLLFSTEFMTKVSSQVSSSEPVSAPSIEWQEKYDSRVLEPSNLIQTSDGGYVFMNLGWKHIIFFPATVYKVDSLGNLQWNKTVEDLRASTIIQTNDEGYEIAGEWRSASHPTLIKMDSQGSIEWVLNYSSVPDLGVSSTRSIQTSDGGFVYWIGGSVNNERGDGTITKTDSNNSTQWVKQLIYRSSDGTAPLKLYSVIETSDGAIAALGVGRRLFDNLFTGSIYLIKIQAFLPLPSQTPLPTPILKPLPTVTVEAAVIVSLFVGVFVVAGLLVFLKKRKH